jgi:diacylglycerol kinase family enzyme
VRGVTSGLQGSHLPLGIIPIGTGNVLAEEIRFRCSPKKLARNLVYGPAVQVSGGEANGTFFLTMAGAGFDAHVLSHLNMKWKRLLGKIAYTFPVLKELRQKQSSFTVEVDSKTYQCNWLIVTKVSRYGGPFHLVEQQKLWNDGFHAVLVHNKSRMSLAWILLMLGLGRLETHPDVTILPCHRVFVPSQPGIPTQLDGENFGSMPLEILPSDKPVNIIFPLAENSGCRILSS